ncbi:MAG: thioredoxin domain-containing protein [Sphingomonadales bacterium]|nr:thioredoxin domain-containing protein [Sphingomonadales bacterium]
MTIGKSVVLKLFSLGLFISMAGLSLGNQALAQTTMSEEETKAIEEIVRNYILEHPEIIPEAVGILQARQEAIHQQEMSAAVIANQGKLLNDGFSVVVGNPDGDITLVEFYDYRCPYCVQSHDDVKRLLANDPNLRVVYKQFPVKDRQGEEPVSLTAARMSQAIAKQGVFLFEEFQDRVMALNTQMNIEDLGRISSEIGVDMTRLQLDLQEPAILDGIRDNFTLAREIGITGTPSFIVGEKVFVGALGYERMKAIIDEARAAN